MGKIYIVFFNHVRGAPHWQADIWFINSPAKIYQSLVLNSTGTEGAGQGAAVGGRTDRVRRLCLTSATVCGSTWKSNTRPLAIPRQGRSDSRPACLNTDWASALSAAGRACHTHIHTDTPVGWFSYLPVSKSRDCRSVNVHNAFFFLPDCTFHTVELKDELSAAHVYSNPLLIILYSFFKELFLLLLLDSNSVSHYFLHCLCVLISSYLLSPTVKLYISKMSPHECHQYTKSLYNLLTYS